MLTCLINSFPLIPAETAFRGSPSYRPISPSSIAPLTSRYRPPGRPPKPCCLDKSIPCAHKTITLHTITLSTTFTNNFCACQSSPFTDIRLICSVFVEFITSFYHVLREHIGLRPFFAISYLRVLTVFVWVSHVKKID